MTFFFSRLCFLVPGGPDQRGDFCGGHGDREHDGDGDGEGEGAWPPRAGLGT